MNGLNASAYQRVRLWSGIFSIGLHLALVWGVFWALPVWEPWLGGSVPLPVATAVLAVGFTVAGFVFDLLAGHAVETALGRTRQPLRAWLVDWVSGAGRYALALWVGFTALGYAHMLSPVAAIGLSFTLLAGLALLAWKGCRLLPLRWRARSDPDREAHARMAEAEARSLGLPAFATEWIEDVDEQSVNGELLPGKRPVLRLSTNVAAQLTPRQTALLAAREFWFLHSGARAAGGAIVLGWILAGWLGVFLLPVDSALERATCGAAVVTTWSFLALWIWPHLNRRWMHAADRSLLAHAPVAEVAELLRRVQELNQTDVELPPSKTAVFHPIPPLNRRLERLNA